MSQTPIPKILMVEDNEDLQSAMQDSFGDLWSITWAQDLSQAEKSLKTEAFDLVLLDVKLPDGLGYSFCEKIQSDERFSHLPVILLSGKGDVEDRIHGFEIGADDYILKPFEPKEFVARIKSKLRAPKAKSTKILKGKFKIDLHSVRAWMIQNDGSMKDLGLTPNEFKLLAHFLDHEKQILSREQLLKSLWGEAVHVSPHTIDTHISSLRKKLGSNGNFIRAVVKQGYVFSSGDEELQNKK